MMGAVFAMQGFGQLAGALVMLFLTLGFKESLLTATKYSTCTGVCGLAVDRMWRSLVGTELLYSPVLTNANLAIIRYRSSPSLRCSLLPPYHPGNPKIYLRRCPRCRESPNRRDSLHDRKA